MKKNLFCLLIIIIFGAVLRLYNLTSNPPSLNWDEVSHGYNAYSILKTGKDQWGQFLPIANFRAYGDYPLPLNLYLTIPFIVVMGLNALSIRLPHALLGILTIIAVYFLTDSLTGKKKIAILAAFLVSIEPWYVFTSRFVLQSNLSVFFLISGMALFLNRRKNIFFLPLSFFCFGLTIFSYHTTRIFTPLFLLILLFLYKDELFDFSKHQKTTKIISFIALLIFFLPLPFILVQPQARARSNMVFIINEGAINNIIHNREESHLPDPIKKVFYNKPVYFIKQFSKNYIEYFSPQFLFTSGGTQYQFSIPQHGLLYLVNLPFFYLGLLLLLKKIKKEKKYQLIFAWLLLSPIPASITTEQYAVLRSSSMLPIPTILSAMGAYTAFLWLIKKFKWDKKYFYRSIVFVYVGLLLLLAGNYFFDYFTSYRLGYSWVWQYGYKEVVDYARSHYADYDRIIVTKKYGEPHEFFLFFWPWNPKEYRNDPKLISLKKSDWYWVDRFDKFYFVNDWNIPRTESGIWNLESGGKVDISEKTLLITSPGNYPSSWRLLKTINFLNGKPAFDILENTAYNKGNKK